MLQTNSVTKQIEGKAVNSKLYQTHHLFIHYNWTNVTLEPIFHKMTPIINVIRIWHYPSWLSN
jgi:hypothetical protein